MKKSLKNILGKAKPSCGLWMVAAGATLAIASAVTGWTDINAVQLSALTLVVAGIAIHVALAKRQSRY